MYSYTHCNQKQLVYQIVGEDSQANVLAENFLTLYVTDHGRRYASADQFPAKVYR